MWFKTLSFIGLFSIVTAARSYENYKLYTIVPTSEYQVDLLDNLKKEGYDFWNIINDANVPNKESRVLVSPENVENFKIYIEGAGMVANLSCSNVQEWINEQMRPAVGRSARLGSHSWNAYHPLGKIYAWLDELAELYPEIVTVVNIGNSYEGRTIKGVVIDLKAGEREGTPTMAFVEGGLHAREWISPAFATWMIKELLTSTDPEVQFLAEAVVWHIFPVTNPDGYEYSFKADRAWRKNRNPLIPEPAGPCVANPDWGIGSEPIGVDLNRNFDFMWNTTGSSSDPCDITYAGTSAASELETQAIVSHITNIQKTGNLVYYFALHSAAQMFMLPLSHLSGRRKLEVPHFGDLFEIASRGAEALTAVHGTPYQVGVAIELFCPFNINCNPLSGGGFDWALGVAKIPITILFELRDTGPYSFLLPPAQIIPNNEEAMASLVEIEKTTRMLGYYSYKAAGNRGVALSSLFTLIFSTLFMLFK